MLAYNTQQENLKLPEYGRNVQRMVNHCMTIEDRDERTACAHTIIDTMYTLVPPTGDPKKYRRTLWNHLAIMSDFQLDIDWPCEVIESDRLHEQPDPVYYSINDIRYRHYGKNIETMVEYVSQMPESGERDAMQLLVANHMKKLMLAVNPDGVDDAKIFKDLRHLSHGRVNLAPETVHLHEFKTLAPPKKKKKK